MENIVVKAFNPDNEAEALQLVRLFERSFGRDFPVKSVYDMRFWKTHGGNRFTSLIALDRYKVVAHVSIRSDRDDDRNIQAFMPICDPDYLNGFKEMKSAFSSLVSKIAANRGCRMIYYYAISGLSEMEDFAGEIIGGKEVAILPRAIAVDGKDANERVSIHIHQKILSSQTALQDPLYVPAHHVKVTQHIYSSLGVKAPLLSSARRAGHRESALPADRRAMETRGYRKSGIYLSSVEPSILSDMNGTVSELIRYTRSQHYIGVNLFDSKAPEFCRLLEAAGYGYCGVLPYHCGRQRVLFSNQCWKAGLNDSIGKEDSVLARYLSQSAPAVQA